MRVKVNCNLYAVATRLSKITPFYRWNPVEPTTKNLPLIEAPLLRTEWLLLQKHTMREFV